jgi:hypothetical protein
MWVHGHGERRRWPARTKTRLAIVLLGRASTERLLTNIAILGVTARERM